MRGTTNIYAPPPFRPGVHDAVRSQRCAAPRRGGPASGAIGRRAPDDGRQPAAGAAVRARPAPLPGSAGARLGQLRSELESRAGDRRRGQAVARGLAQGPARQPLLARARVRTGGAPGRLDRRQRPFRPRPGPGTSLPHPRRQGARPVRPDHLRRSRAGRSTRLVARRRLAHPRRLERGGQTTVGFHPVLRQDPARRRLHEPRHLGRRREGPGARRRDQSAARLSPARACRSLPGRRGHRESHRATPGTRAAAGRRPDGSVLPAARCRGPARHRRRACGRRPRPVAQRLAGGHRLRRYRALRRVATLVKLRAMTTPSAVPQAEAERLAARIAELEHERKHLLAIIEILKEISGSLHFIDILQSIARKLGEAFGLDRCSIFLAERGGASVRLVASYEDPTIRNYVVDLERYPELRRAIRGGETVFIPDAASDPSLKHVRSDLINRRVKSITVVPINWRSVAIGAIFLRTFRDGQTFSDSDVRFVQVVAALTAQALRNAHRYERLALRQQETGEQDRGMELERVALLSFLRRLVQGFGRQDGAWGEGLLPKASAEELDRLVGVALAVIQEEAKGR